MTTTYPSENSLIGQAKAKAKRKTRKWYALSAVGVVFAGGAAFAAVQLFGFGSINAQPATLKNLTVDNARLTGTLAPGQSVGGASEVGNGNDFPVTVTAVILKDSSLQVTGTSCDGSTVTPGGSPGTYPGGGPGHLITLATPVQIPAGQARTVTASNVVSQSPGATALCGVGADFAIVAQVGS